MDGVDVTELSPAQTATRRAWAGSSRTPGIWPSMTVSEAIATALEQFVPVRDPLAAALAWPSRSGPRTTVTIGGPTELVREFGLERFAESFISELSTGTRRVVELACARGPRAPGAALDEPTSGIAQRESEALGELLLGLREQTGAAFIIIEHDVPLVSSLADRMVCMHLGEVIAEGETTEVLDQSPGRLGLPRRRCSRRQSLGPHAGPAPRPS